MFNPRVVAPDGRLSPLSSVYMWMPRAICFKLLTHEACFALAFARANAGNNNPARIAMMAMTTNSSINVNPPRRDFGDTLNLAPTFLPLLLIPMVAITSYDGVIV